MRVLIVGCGYVGTALGLELLEAGHQVWGMRRNIHELPSGLIPMAADLATPSQWPAFPDRLDAVVYATAADGFQESLYRLAYVDGLTHVLDTLRPSYPDTKPRILLTSSTSVYAQQEGEWVDETSPTYPTHFGGTLILEGEKRLHASEFPSSVVRLGGIYGPQRTRLLESVREQSAVLMPGPTYTNRIHREDCAGVLHHLLKHPDPAPLYLGVDRAPTSRTEVLCWMAEQFGVPAPTLGDTAAQKSRRRRSNKRCRSDLLVASGYSFRFPSFREGYLPLILSMKSGDSEGL